MAVPHTCDASALPGARTTGPEESPDAPRPTDPPSTAADRGRRPLSLFPSRGSPKRAGASSSFPTRTDPTFETDAPAADEGPPAATGPDASGDAPETTDRRFSKGRARERGHGPATPEPDPRPRGGTGHRCSPIVGTLPGRGGARRLHTARRNERHTRTRRARRGRGRGNGKDGEAREGPLAAGTDGADGWDPGAHRHPAPLFPLGSAPRGVRTPSHSGERGDRGGSRGARARARRGPLRPPTTGNNIPGSGTARRRHGTLSFAPRGSSPDSERGGAGRSGHTNARVPPPKVGTRRGEPGQSYAHRAGHGAGRGDPRRVRRETPSTPFHRIAREGTFLAEGGRDGPDPTSRRPRQPQERGKRRSMISNVARRGGSAVSVRASLYLFPSGGAFSSVTRTGGTGPRKSINYKLGPPRARPLRHHPPALHRTGRHSIRLTLKPTSNGEKNRKGRPRQLNTTTRRSKAYGRRQRVVGRSPDLTGARERRFIVPRSRRGGRTQRASFLPLASTPTRTHLRRGTPPKAGPRAGGHTRRRNGKRRRRSVPGTSEDRPGTLQEHREDRERDARTQSPFGKGV